MELSIETIPASRIAYFRSIGEYGSRQNKEAMESLKTWAIQNNLLTNSTILGIPQDDPSQTPKEECRYDVCLLIDNDFNVTEPAKFGQFGGGTYAVFLVKHTSEALADFWNRLFTIINKNGLHMKQQPIIERYTAEMLEKELCELLVPVEHHGAN
ncbi:AraC family transcriptional regulator [Shouchella patagoniensis]|uniref:AraC family transcriptional regulator n=1 Tax=Shouchella patagoniensis TaxID=228576 RepID=UPI000994FFB1|nr:GyrI-like domain-containing protein [Shouchella patagoniensis]